MKEKTKFNGPDNLKLESKKIIFPISEMVKKVGRVALEVIYFPIKFVEDLRPRKK